MSQFVIKNDSFDAFQNSVLKYAMDFASEYNIAISEARFNHVVDNMMSPDFLLSKSKQSYRRYIRITGLCSKNKDFLEYGTNENSKVEGAVLFTVQHLCRASLMEISHSSVASLLYAAYAFLINKKKPPKFVSQRFSNAVVHVLRRLRSFFEDMPEAKRGSWVWKPSKVS